MIDIETLSMRELKSLHRAVLGTEAKARDRAKLARKILNWAAGDDKRKAKIQAAVGKLDPAPPRKGSSKARVVEAVGKLDAAEATRLLAEVGGLLIEEDQLRTDKRETLKGIREDIATYRGSLEQAVADWREAPDDNDPAKVLGKVERSWRQVVVYEGRAKLEAEDYNEQIKAVTQRTRSVLDSIRQRRLPGIE